MTDLVTGLRANLFNRKRPRSLAWTVWAAISDRAARKPQHDLKSGAGGRDEANFRKALPSKKVVLQRLGRPPALVHRWQSPPRQR
jgi:hypothetical protein